MRRFVHRGNKVGKEIDGEEQSVVNKVGRVLEVGVRESSLGEGREGEKYGPIFKTAFFFKPTIVFGSKEAVEEFKSFEASLPADEGRCRRRLELQDREDFFFDFSQKSVVKKSRRRRG